MNLLRIITFVIFMLGINIMSQADTQTGSNHEFTIHVPDTVLDDLHSRLKHTRWPDQVRDSGWDYGTNLDYLKELVAYWANDFDWRAQEQQLNSFKNYKVDIDGIGIHFIHEKSPDKDAIPLLILHGWPSSFVQMLDLIPLLTKPDGDSPSFDVVVVSLPGYGFSDAFTERGMGMEQIADLMSKLMTEVLGYPRYGLRGSDLGGTVIQQMALKYPEQVIGAHLTGIIIPGGMPPPADATPAEQEFLDATTAMWLTEMSYARQHSSKPQTLAYGLNDSPAGLSGWIIEKFWKWGDTGGDIESRFSKDELLTNLTIYWVTESIGPSIRLYYELVRNRGRTGRVDIPVGMLMTHKDMFPVAPREWAERSYNIVHWTEINTGGHFLEWEEPVLVARDLQEFFKALK